jgi:hypothetical protein
MGDAIKLAVYKFASISKDDQKLSYNHVIAISMWLQKLFSTEGQETIVHEGGGGVPVLTATASGRE